MGENYGLTLLDAEKTGLGAGSDTWFVRCREGRFVVKFPAQGGMNHPELEPALCRYLLDRGLPVCRFVENRAGNCLSRDDSGRLYHVQDFLPGRVWDLNAAPDWLLPALAALLGQIHTALRDYPGLPEGIGPGFFTSMTPRRARESYEASLETARRLGDRDVAEDLVWRLGYLDRWEPERFDFERLSCKATHGDFFISQLQCLPDRISAVIDWTTACVHPVVWEVFRSYLYADPACRTGTVEPRRLAGYVRAYLACAPLNAYDLAVMPELYAHQLAVCDYYGQYYGSPADNRAIYLWQARHATGFLRAYERDRAAICGALREL